MDTWQVVVEPRRRAILAMLRDRELPAGEIAAAFDVTFSAVSQHLAVLREAGLVTVRREGTRRLYRSDEAALVRYRAVLEPMWGDTLGRLADTAESSETPSKETR